MHSFKAERLALDCQFVDISAIAPMSIFWLFR